MPPEPLISVVIPVRNGAPFLPSAMDSVLAQGYRRLEVLLVDDGSTDDLPGRIEPYREVLRYIRQEPRGQSAARNRGICESAGGLIAFLDIDDLWAHSHVRTLLGALQDNPGAGIAQGMMRQFWTTQDGRCYRTVPYRMPYLGSCLFHRAVFLACGLFDETMSYGEDHDFFYRCWEHDIVKVNVDTLSLLYRRHARNMTHGHYREQVLVLQRRIERIRRGDVDPAAERRQRFQQYIGEPTPLSRLSYQEVGECDLLSV
jgi:glycosyltransferase involved in cell wall biosynthesis